MGTILQGECLCRQSRTPMFSTTMGERKTSDQPGTPLLKVEGLEVTYPGTAGNPIRAVRGVSFQISKGSVVGLVGESGSGKSTLARCLVKLVPPTGGRIIYEETDLTHLSQRQVMPWRKRIQMVFQDPYTSLNPRRTVAQILSEPFMIHEPSCRGNKRMERINALLDQVGLNPGEYRHRFPSELSGGQRQRVGIARALAVQPELLICDEPVSALDVSVQAQIINLLKKLRQELGLTLLFIAHDLAVVENISDEILVMRRGEIVERGPADQLYRHAFHPYTRELMAAAPRL